MLKWLHCPQRAWWQPTGSCVRSATKGFKESRTCSFIGEATTCHGNWSRDQAKSWSGKRSTYAQRFHVCITAHQGLLGTSQASRNTSQGSMERRSTSVKSAQRSMQFIPIGRLTPRLVALESIDVIVAPSSQGRFQSLLDSISLVRDFITAPKLRSWDDGYE